ncbi:hypothetical protein B0A49_02774 [Cryomyces minteri]|uniref:Uncharacterized protein n=1 Tax=Cryomyces minteri TaxID=331657 RepID=A0A4U0XML1_9PEZI|nr:hypothetical protein B0A49_02774 [Cryomyces minteri]
MTSGGQTHYIVDSSTGVLAALTSSFAPLPAPLIVGSKSYTAKSQSKYVVGEQTIAVGTTVTLGAGVSTTVVALQTNSFGQTEVMIGSSILALPTATALATSAGSPALTVGGQTLTANHQNAYVVSDSTLGVGKTVILGSGASTTAVGMQTNSVGSTEIVVGSSTSLLSASTATLVPPPIVVGTRTIAANAQSRYTVAGHTLAVGFPITIGSGASTTIVVLQTNSAGATEVLVGSSTSVLPTVPSSINLVTVAGETYMPSIVTGYIHDAQTLYPNGPSITLTPTSGTSALLAALKTGAAGVTELVVGSTTSTLSPAATAPLVVAEQTFTPNLQSEYIIAGQTLYPGTVITVSGTPVSLEAYATAVVVGTSTEGLGGYIMSGLGGPSSGTLTTPTTPVMATSAVSVTKTTSTVAASAATVSGTGAVASRGRAERPWGSAWCLGLSVVLLAASGVLKT